MGFFDFLKRFTQPEPEQVQEMRFEDIEKYVEDKLHEHEKEKQDIMLEIKIRLSKLIEDLEAHVRLLKDIDLDERKVEDRVRFIVKENLNYYISHIEKLIKNLKQLENSENIIRQVEPIFHDFEKKSSINFQKATFLVGKEIEDVVKSISSFFTDFKRTIKNNKQLLDSYNTLSSIQENLTKIDEAIKNQSNIQENIKKFDKKKEKIEQEKKQIQKQIKDVKATPDYIEELDKIQELEQDRQNIKYSINDLRKTIDFKSLANIYHKSEKSMNLINIFKTDFQESFERYNKELLEFAEDLGNKEEVEKQIKEINNNIESINKTRLMTPNQDKIKDLESRSTKLDQNIDEININMIKEQKRKEKIDQQKQQIINQIKQEAGKINLIIN